MKACVFYLLNKAPTYNEKLGKKKLKYVFHI